MVDIHRFTHEWEKATSLALRHGQPEAVDAYLIADSTHAVNDLNTRARAERVLRGDVDAGRSVALVEGTHAAAGDLVITRRNDRRLRTLRHGWVRNGDRWHVRDVRTDGSLVVRRQGARIGASIVLPATYVADLVDLGYAVTAHRAQGLTVDTAHVVAAETTTRENLYVAMTRGRESNIAYVALDDADESHGRIPGEEVSVRDVLLKILVNTGAEPSAHQAIRAEQKTWGSIARMAAEYETIAAAGQHDRWATLARASGLTGKQAEAAISSEAFGPLAAELRRAEANGHQVERLLPAVVARHGLNDADDIGAVLRHRVALATS